MSYSYEWGESKHEQIGMIVNGKPVVMGAYSVNDPVSGVTTMTVYTADKDGFKPTFSYRFNKKTRDMLLKASLLGWFRILW